MTSYVALIRGIRPGDPRKSNASLVGVLEELGLADVRPVISSGNVVFTSDEDDAEALGDRIEAAWPELRGFTATTIVRPRAWIERFLDRLPFGDVPHCKETYQLVTFFKHAVPETVASPDDLAVEVLGLVEGALCTVTDTTAARGPEAMAWLERACGKAITSRTPLTLQRILTRMR